MSGYIGSQPADSFLSITSQQITGNGGATYTLNSSVTSPEDLAVFVNNIRQNPNNYSVSNNQITLGGTIASSDSCYVVFLGKTLATVSPPLSSVGLTQLSATGTKNNTTFLRGDNTFATPSGGTNTPNFFAYLNANQTNFNDTSFTKVAYNAELFDTGNGFDTSSGTYTIPESGKYFIALQVRKSNIQTSRFLAEIKENGSTFTKSFEHGGYSGYGAVTGNYIKSYSANDTLEVFLYQQSGATRTMRGGADAKDSWFYGFKIIE